MHKSNLKERCMNLTHNTIAETYCCAETGIDSKKADVILGTSGTLTSDGWLLDNLPRRPRDSNKGSFGKTLVICGSDKYRGAAHLTLAAALRGGAGYVTYLGSAELARELRAVYPEAIYVDKYDVNTLDGGGVSQICEISKGCTSSVIGSGSGVSRSLFSLIRALIFIEGGTLIIDADGLNSISRYAESVEDVFRIARRKIIITPHPLELSRLSGLSVEAIQSDRICVARRLASEWGVVLLLKGADTVITDGERLLINGSGSSALAKAGSGDVLSGLLASVAAYTADPLTAAGIAAYLHGKAADGLAKELTDYGVTPSDLPREICKTLARIIKGG